MNRASVLKKKCVQNLNRRYEMDDRISTDKHFVLCVPGSNRIALICNKKYCVVTLFVARLFRNNLQINIHNVCSGLDSSYLGDYILNYCNV